VAPVPPYAAPGRSPRYPNYVLAVLVAVNMFNFIDRQIVAILLQQIKQEFSATDAQLGLLTGFSFILVHALIGVPIARYADRGSRRTVIAIGVAVWSAMTALSGGARSFVQLALLRVGVGIGEAAGTPPSHSLISDYFPPNRRARALSVQAIGLYGGIMFGYLAAGWLGQLIGWRATMVAVGLPGLALALLVWRTVDEPPRPAGETVPPVREVVSYLAARRSYLILLVAAAFHACAGYGLAQWSPTFLVRVHGLSYAEVGAALGVLSGTMGAAGAITGGWLADRYGSRDRRWYTWIAAIAAFANVPFVALFLLIDSTALALACYAPHIFTAGLYTGPLYAMNQGLARPRMRATAVALHLLVVGIVGGGASPWLIGSLSDAFAAEQGSAALRSALLIVVCATSALAGVGYLAAARWLRTDLSTAEELPRPIAPQRL
jgi:predicted MFS family arabinose efflux permease